MTTVLTIKESVEQIRKSFSLDSYILYSAFMMTTPKDFEKEAWQILFYNRQEEKVKSFKKVDEIWKESEESEVLKDGDIQELVLSEIKIDLDVAIDKGEEELRQHGEEATKIIIMLQQKETPIWNISFITNIFNLLNIRVDAITGEVLDKNHSSLLNFKTEPQ